MENKDFIKHLVRCKCILPQYENLKEPILHKFIVFSELDNYGFVIPSFTQCNNCGVIHKVLEVGHSEFTRKDSLSTLPQIKEIKLELPEKLTAVLDGYNLDLPTWQELSWIFKNEAWGRMVILTKEEIDGVQTGKYIQIFSDSMLKINSFTKEENVASND